MSRGLSRQQLAILLAMREREQRDCLSFRPPVPTTPHHRRDTDAAREHKRYGACKGCVTTVRNVYEALYLTSDRERRRQKDKGLRESAPALTDRELSLPNCHAKGRHTHLVSVDRALRSLEQRGWVRRLGVYKDRGYSDGKGRWVLAWVTRWHRALQ
jgi:hypothetical protein